jgi:hypothetical protein
MSDTSEIKFIKGTMFRHRNILKDTWTSLDAKNHNQIDHTLMDKGWHSSILDIRSFRGADSDKDNYLVDSKIRETLAE